MNYPPKEMTCKCGNKVTVDRERIWCTNCLHPVYYEPAAQTKHKWNSRYMMFLIVATMLLLAYVFMEAIIIPTMELL